MEIRDDELVLRPIASEDASAIAAGLDDAEAARFLLSIPSPYTEAEAAAWVERCEEAWRNNESYPLAILDGESGAFLGSIELHRAPATVGYWVAASARGRGVATRALRLACEWWSVRPLHLTAHPANIASQRVAVKAGFRRIGMTTDHPAFRDGTREAVLFELA